MKNLIDSSGPDGAKVLAGRSAGEVASVPYRIRLPGFVKDEEIGLGDVITRATQSLGIKACGGCGRRAVALNRRLVITR